MTRLPSVLAASVLSVLSLTGCIVGADDETEADIGADDLDSEDMSGVDPETGLLAVITKQATVNQIKATAAARGITNPMLIAGVAWAETNLSHCRADYYTQQCAQSAGTPTSPSCGGGSVLIGNADPSCDQGGLGLFQIDYGTQKQTIAHYGARVLSLSGNIGIGIDHILNDLRLCSLTPSFGSDTPVALQRATAWLNNAKRGTADYNTFMMCMSRHYNGAGTQAQANYYRAKTEEVFNKYGAGTGTGTTGYPGTVNTDGTPLNVRVDASGSSALVSTLPNGSAVTIKCQKRGQTMTGTYGTSDLWDNVGNGFVADVYILTSSDDQVAPTCP